MQSTFITIFKGLTSDIIQKAGAANGVVKRICYVTKMLRQSSRSEAN
jgi:hypothetical protein